MKPKCALFLSIFLWAVPSGGNEPCRKVALLVGGSPRFQKLLARADRWEFVHNGAMWERIAATVRETPVASGEKTTVRLNGSEVSVVLELGFVEGRFSVNIPYVRVAGPSVGGGVPHPSLKFAKLFAAILQGVRGRVEKSPGRIREIELKGDTVVNRGLRKLLEDLGFQGSRGVVPWFVAAAVVPKFAALAIRAPLAPHIPPELLQSTYVIGKFVKLQYWDAKDYRLVLEVEEPASPPTE